MKALNLSVLALAIVFSTPAFAESLLAKEAKEAVRARLIDEDSAKFKIDYEKNGVICGQVNSKNRLGGYTGYSRFMYIKSASKNDAPELRMVDATVKPSDGLTQAALDNILVEGLCDDLVKAK